MANQNLPAKNNNFQPSQVALKTMNFYAKEYKLVPEIHFVFLGGSPYITSDGLLWLGNNHPDKEKRIKDIAVDILKADFTKQEFIVKAVIALYNGQTFEGIGTATVNNLTKITQNHPLEMAETRAVSRALRKAYAIGIPSAEELTDIPKAPNVKDKNEKSKDIISEAQRKRLWAIAREYGVSDKEVKEIIERYGYESTRDIKRKDYEKIISDIEAIAEREPEFEEKEGSLED